MMQFLTELFSPNARARRMFEQQRTELESAFFEQASSSGKPRGLSWKRISFEPKPLLLRDRNTGELTMLVGCTIEFEPIEGGGMELVEAAYERREATAVFHRSQRGWGTAGRVLFNLTPGQAARQLGKQYVLCT